MSDITDLNMKNIGLVFGFLAIGLRLAGMERQINTNSAQAELVKVKTSMAP